jgi:type II secretory pathway component PulF
MIVHSRLRKEPAVGQEQLSGSEASDLIWVCRHLAAALQGDVTVLRALDAISETAPPRARRLVQAMREAGAVGGRMGQSLAPLGIPSFVCSTIWAGEASNRLAISATKLAEQLELEQQLPPPRDLTLFTWGLAFSRIAMMLKEGVPVVQAFQVGAEAAGLPEVREALLAAREAIKDGLLVGNILPAVTEGLPPMVFEMIGDGEVTGRLDTTLSVIADYLFDEAGQQGEEEADHA